MWAVNFWRFVPDVSRIGIDYAGIFYTKTRLNLSRDNMNILEQINCNLEGLN
jgi:hypothetical protein